MGDVVQLVKVGTVPPICKVWRRIRRLCSGSIWLRSIVAPLLLFLFLVFFLFLFLFVFLFVSFFGLAASLFCFAIRPWPVSMTWFASILVDNVLRTRPDKTWINPAPLSLGIWPILCQWLYLSRATCPHHLLFDGHRIRFKEYSGHYTVDKFPAPIDWLLKLPKLKWVENCVTGGRQLVCDIQLTSFAFQYHRDIKVKTEVKCWTFRSAGATNRCCWHEIMKIMKIMKISVNIWINNSYLFWMPSQRPSLGRPCRFVFD